MDCVSIPLGLRFKAGKKVKFIHEVGTFTDIIINSIEIYHVNNIEYTKNIDGIGGVGCYMSIGVSLTGKKEDITLKLDGQLRISKYLYYVDDIRLCFCIKFNEQQ